VSKNVANWNGGPTTPLAFKASRPWTLRSGL